MTITSTFSLVEHMKTLLLGIMLLTAWTSDSALAAPAWDGSYTSFAGNYLIYSNDLDEKAPPTAKDRRVSFSVDGALSKKLFESIGPDVKEACGASADLRIRVRGDLTCTFERNEKKSPYNCHFGLDLRSGKSISGSTC
ncbi:hypothetical protein [Pseudoduganella violaceinigra]|uniref:hypothetical protein n=1 Tax=Pseudoduganella violaceinigra TaxID=246602 RepID=UPI001E558A3A|nr:hypothetical protein [Pseudoduganella violaceinigra]